MVAIASEERNKEIYTSLHDTIIQKRYRSTYPIRRYAHRLQHQMFVDALPAGATVLDAGCGEGVLSMLLARHGCQVTGVDLSVPNIEAAGAFARAEGVGDRITFRTGDVEHLPFPDQSFDYVVSSHVLEHLPDFVQGVRECARVARKGVIIAIPTCLSLGAASLLGGDPFWVLSRKSLLGIPKGMCRILRALITGAEGVNEGYEGNMELIHIWRFPWKGRQLLEQGGLTVVRYGGSGFIFPYLAFLLPVSRLLQRLTYWPILRNFGHGTTYICVPNRSGASWSSAPRI